MQALYVVQRFCSLAFHRNEGKRSYFAATPSLPFPAPSRRVWMGNDIDEDEEEEEQLKEDVDNIMVEIRYEISFSCIYD